MAHCEEVIITTITRGEGTELSPIRTVVQVFKKSGELIAEQDSLPLGYTINQINLSKAWDNGFSVAEEYQASCSAGFKFIQEKKAKFLKDLASGV